MEGFAKEISQRTLIEYQERLTRVLNYIDENLDSELSLRVLSDISCFSMYHFHRIFSAIVGESLNSYVKRLRLTKAAYKLIHTPNKSISSIALECGFCSPSDFSRSFKEFYKVSPGQYSSKKKSIDNNFGTIISNELGIQKLNFSAIDNSYEENIRVDILEDLYVAYIRVQGLSPNVKSLEIEKAFKRLYTWASARELLKPSTSILGVTLDSPEVIDFEKCRYDVCITLPHPMEPSGDIGVRHIKASGKYVIYRFCRNSDKLSANYFSALNYIYGHWMPYNGYFPGDSPFIEFHHADTASTNIYTDFCIPINPL